MAFGGCGFAFSFGAAAMGVSEGASSFFGAGASSPAGAAASATSASTGVSTFASGADAMIDIRALLWLSSGSLGGLNRNGNG